MRHKIIAVTGLSNSGKDTVATQVTELCHAQGQPVLHYKFKHWYTRHLEDVYGLQPGTLDTTEGKAKLVPGSTLTWLDLLIEAYHFYQRVAPLSSALGLGARLEKLTEPTVVVVTDCRTTHEARALAYHQSYLVHWAIKGRGHELSSDHHLEKINLLLLASSHQSRFIDNSGSLDALKSRVKQLLDKIPQPC